MPWFEKTAHEIRKAIQSGETCATAVTEEHLARIDAVDPQIDAYTQVWRDAALAQAAAIDAKLQKGEDPGALAGVPVALKEVLCTREGETTCASKILAGFQSPFDATVVRKLEDAGAVLLGKVNMDEFAMGSSTENSSIKTTKNPWNLDCVPGGSSGGSAAAVSADMCAFSLGSDTGGSIRQPATFCGCVGVKPTYGRVSRYGLVAFASSLDQVGALTKDVEDAALVLSVICGRDPMDCDVGGPAGAGLRRGIDGRRQRAAHRPAEGVLHGRARPRDAREGRGRGRGLTASGRRGRRGLPAARGLRHCDVLHHLHGRGQREFGAFRRRALWLPPSGRPGHAGHVRDEQDRGLRARGQAPHHARHLRPLERLLRRLLPQSAEGAAADQAGLRPGLHPVRCDRHAHVAHAGLPHRLENRRSPRDVPDGHLHHLGQPGHVARHLGALRADGFRVAGRLAVARQAL